MNGLSRLESDRLSTYRTEHVFEHHAEFTSVEQYELLVAEAGRRGLPVVVLGNGSNVLFRRRGVRTAVLRNKLPRVMETLGEPGRVRASSATPISVILKHCQKHGLDSFYYLASVPATVGGAIAMNAGRGEKHGLTIFDFVSRVRWTESGEVQEADAAGIPRRYRWTPFTGCTTKLILDVEFNFSPATCGGEPIQERIAWAKQQQDHATPNCGSVFKEAHFGLLKRFRGVHLGSAGWSKKTTNWLQTRGKSSRPLVVLVRLAQAAHLLIGRRARLELILVD